MEKTKKEQLKQKVILGAREYGIGSVLFRHAIGERLGVGVTDMECLGLIFLKGLVTPSELSRYAGLSSGATTALLDRLEKSKLIVRRPNPNDRRSSHIVLVEETTKSIAPMFASLRAAQDEIVSSYTEDELALLADFFERSITMWGEERQKLVDGQKK
ncbi:MAG: MarR family transcriptional regulator [Anaerolineae bacterium]|nr:MarR family transcriptional regulator [Anaerolineae bacterium]